MPSEERATTSPNRSDTGGESGNSAQTQLADIAALRASLDSVTPVFVLVDPLAGEPLPGIAANADGTDPKAAREAVWQREVTRIPLQSRIPLPLSMHPYLVSLRGLDDPLLGTTLDHVHCARETAHGEGLDGSGGARYSVGGWLQSTMHPPQLGQALADMFRLRTNAWTGKTYLRLPDPRTLDLLRYVAGDVRVAQQFGRVQRWTYVDSLGTLSTIVTPGEEITPLHLDWREWKRIEEPEVIHRTLALWRGEQVRRGEIGAPHCPIRECFESVEQAVAQARRNVKRWPHRFPTPVDQAVWSALCLLHPGMQVSAAVHALMDETGSADEPARPLSDIYPQLFAAFIAEPETAQTH